MSKKSAKTAGIVSVVLLALTLAGCDHFVADPLSYTVVASSPVVRACLPMTIVSMTVETFGDDENDRGEVVWEATGNAALEAGTEFAIGIPLDGFTVNIDKRQPRLDETFTFDMEVLTPSGNRRHTDSYFEAGALSSGVWLDGYGQALDVPCSHEPCQPGWTCLNDWEEPDGRELDPSPTFSPTGVPVTE